MGNFTLVVDSEVTEFETLDEIIYHTWQKMDELDKREDSEFNDSERATLRNIYIKIRDLILKNHKQFFFETPFRGIDLPVSYFSA